MNITRGLLFAAILITLGAINAVSNGDVIASVLTITLTLIAWVVAARRLRANLNDRGGYLNDL